MGIAEIRIICVCAQETAEGGELSRSASTARSWLRTLSFPVVTRAGGGGGVYSDEHSRLDLLRVSFLDVSSGMCPDPEVSCQTNIEWRDSWGDDCAAYAQIPAWCGFEESNDMCCVCGGGEKSKSCEPAGSGGGYFAARNVTVTMQSVDFHRCSSVLTGGAAHLDSQVSANISESTFRDCFAADGGGLHLNGVVALDVRLVIMERNKAIHGSGGGINALEGSTIHIHGGEFSNNYAARLGGVACFKSSNVTFSNGTKMKANRADTNGGSVWADGSVLFLQDVTVQGGFARYRGGGLFLDSSSLVASNSAIFGNSVGAVEDDGGRHGRGGGLAAMYFSSIELRQGSSVNNNTATRLGGGVYLCCDSMMTVSDSSIDGNMVTTGHLDPSALLSHGGGVYAMISAHVELLEGASVSGNFAADGSAGIYLARGSILKATGSKISSNRCSGGVWARGDSLIELINTSVVGNVGKDGGGLFVVESTLIVEGSVIEGNTATGRGGGVYAFKSHFELHNDSSVSGNSAGGVVGGAWEPRGTGFLVPESDLACGGGLFIAESHLTISNSRISRNFALHNGGGVESEFALSVTLSDGASVSHNSAGGSGGGLSLGTSSSFDIEGRVSISSNEARSADAAGGGIWASTSTVSLGAGVIDLHNNTAGQHGGAVALFDGSVLADLGNDVLVLTVRRNTAVRGNGGGFAVSGDSSVSIRSAKVSQNVAGAHGGGLFVGSSKAEIDKATLYEVPKLSFWNLELVHNSAPMGNGGGLCAFSIVNLLPGGRTNATHNTASSGGAVALVDTIIMVQPGHTLRAEHNTARNDGGAIALFTGASLSLLEASACSVVCLSSKRRGGTCEGECMSAACNFDGGDCVKQRMDSAGAEAGRPCDRDKCPLSHQTNAESFFGCKSACFTASCDWSRKECVKPRVSVRACPLIDAAAFASIKNEQRYIMQVLFVSSNVVRLQCV